MKSPRLSNGKGTAILQSLLQEQSDYRWNVNEITHISNQLTSLRLFLHIRGELEHSNCTMRLQLISLTEKMTLNLIQPFTRVLCDSIQIYF